MRKCFLFQRESSRNGQTTNNHDVHTYSGGSGWSLVEPESRLAGRQRFHSNTTFFSYGNHSLHVSSVSASAMLLYFRFHLCFCLVLLPRIFARLSTEGKIRFRRLSLLFCLVFLNALRYKERIEERRLKRLSRRSYLVLLSVRFHYNVCAIVQTLFYSVIVFCFIAMR